MFLKMPFCDFMVFDKVISNLPKNSQLQISNSSAIRYAQLIDIDPSIEVFCNRGPVASTEVHRLRLVRLWLTENQRFLWAEILVFSTIVTPFGIITFRTILKSFSSIMEEEASLKSCQDIMKLRFLILSFETSHHLTAEHLAKMYGLAYSKATDAASLHEAIATLFQQNEKPQLLEIFTPTVENDKILLQYFKELI